MNGKLRFWIIKLYLMINPATFDSLITNYEAKKQHFPRHLFEVIGNVKEDKVITFVQVLLPLYYN